MNVGRGALRAVDMQYPQLFSAYFSRFLIDFDPSTRRWWAGRLEEADEFTKVARMQGIIGSLGDERRDLCKPLGLKSLSPYLAARER